MQGGIKYHCKVFGMTYFSDWTLVSWAIGEHSTQEANESKNDIKKYYIYVRVYNKGSHNLLNDRMQKYI